jgi:ribosomal protein S18 acetylase RimI-like enzyme
MSNVSPMEMNRANHEALLIEPVRRGDEQAALAWIFAELSPQGRAERIGKLRAACANRPVEGLWAAYRGARVVGAVRAHVQPGRTALVTPGCVAPEEPPETARELLSRAVESLPGQGVQVAQAVLETGCGPAADRLLDGGFRHVANVLYLVSLENAFPESAPAEHLEFVPYSQRRHREFAELVERTYEGTLDCVALDAVRAVDDVLAGYRGAGPFDPARWLVARSEGREVGCVLVGEDPAGDPWELVYLGVVPEARGRGHGLALTRHVQWLAREAGRKRIVLAVDVANAPAKRVYAAAGFVGWDRRSVYLRVL